MNVSQPFLLLIVIVNRLKYFGPKRFSTCKKAKETLGQTEKAMYLIPLLIELWM